MLKLDIVIPAWKAQATLFRCLSSIAIQSVANQCRVTIVNDGEENAGYEEIAKQFQNAIGEVLVLNCEKNGGPGDARQAGLDAVKCDYVTFIDADDTLAGPFALEALIHELDEGPTLIMAAGTFVEQQQNEETKQLYFIPHANDMIWMFGKMYRVEKLRDLGIHFLPGSRANEDNGFNTTIRLLVDDDHQVKYINDTVYVWISSPDSITRINNCQYSYDQSFVGYVDNMLFALHNANERQPYSSDRGYWVVSIMARLYVYWVETEAHALGLLDRNFDLCYKFYPEYRKVPAHEKLFRQAYSEAMEAGYNSKRLYNSFPPLTPKQFLLKMEQRFRENEAANNTKE